MVMQAGERARVGNKVVGTGVSALTKVFSGTQYLSMSISGTEFHEFKKLLSSNLE
jgi:hypothetical protein